MTFSREAGFREACYVAVLFYSFHAQHLLKLDVITFVCLYLPYPVILLTVLGKLTRYKNGYNRSKKATKNSRSCSHPAIGLGAGPERGLVVFIHS